MNFLFCALERHIHFFLLLLLIERFLPKFNKSMLTAAIPATMIISERKFLQILWVLDYKVSDVLFTCSQMAPNWLSKCQAQRWQLLPLATNPPLAPGCVCSYQCCVQKQTQNKQKRSSTASQVLFTLESNTSKGFHNSVKGTTEATLHLYFLECYEVYPSFLSLPKDLGTTHWEMSRGIWVPGLCLNCNWISEWMFLAIPFLLAGMLHHHSWRQGGKGSHTKKQTLTDNEVERRLAKIFSKPPEELISAWNVKYRYSNDKTYTVKKYYWKTYLCMFLLLFKWVK